eukprot:s207_g27.t1
MNKYWSLMNGKNTTHIYSHPKYKTGILTFQLQDTITTQKNNQPYWDLACPIRTSDKLHLPCDIFNLFNVVGMALRGPRHFRGAAKVKDICFHHDPRSGQLCSDSACSKEHIDTLMQDAAERFDRAWRAWQTREWKAKESGLQKPSAPEKSMPAVCSSTPLTSDLPEPPGLFEVPWYYDERWHQRAMSAGMISSCTFLAHSSLWSCMPRLRRYREIHPVQRPIFATQLGRRCGELLHLAPHPVVLCVEKPYLEGFVEGFAQTVTGEFILVVVNGGDAPVTVDQQSIIGKLPGLQACFAMNLHKAVDVNCTDPGLQQVRRCSDGHGSEKLEIGFVDAQAYITWIRTGENCPDTIFENSRILGLTRQGQLKMEDRETLKSYMDEGTT